MNWGKVIRRALITWVVTTLSILFLSWVMHSFSVGGIGSAVVMAAAFGILNSLIWPFLIRLALPLTVLTLGLGVLILNGLVVLAASSLKSESIVVEGLFSAVLVAFGITLVNTILLGALAIEDDDFFYLNVVKRRLSKNKKLKAELKPGQRGVFYLEIDGLAHDILI